jgi:opacity protein-like surface antigen
MVMIAVAATGPAVAGDSGQNVSRPAPAQHSWDGFYVGLTAGAAWGQYDPRTSTDVGGFLGAPAAAAVSAAGSQTIKSTGFVTGIEGGYNRQSGNLLLGVEADLQAVNLQGAVNSGAVSLGATGGQFTVTSYANTDWLFTARPRIGFIAANDWLFYLTGGLAVTQLQSNFSFVDGVNNMESGRLNSVKAGSAVGAGVEAPLTRELSLKAEYLHVDFANTSGALTASTLAPSQVFVHSSDLKTDMIRAGLNYRFGDSDWTSDGNPIIPLKSPVWNDPRSAHSDWTLEMGARLWFTSGKLGAPNPYFDQAPSVYGSRITFSKLDAITGETFARADHDSGLFVKGFLGAGEIASGQEDDEDTLLRFPYSHTQSSSSGSLAYATLDVGYDFLRSSGAKVGAFVGYSFYKQALQVFGCTQIADSIPCPALTSPATLGVSENDHSNALRLGLSSEVTLSDRLKLTTDIAYLPQVSFGGLDDHLVRQLLYFEAAGSGDGVMLEALLSYKISSEWSVGVGGRYWAWNMNAGTFVATPLVPGPPATFPSRYDSERYGVFVQTSYRWGDTPPTVLPTKTIGTATAPMNWTGAYIGGHLGGGWSDARWSDPFGSMPFTPPPGSPPPPQSMSGVDVAGFGDDTHATGPLGGAQIGVNWQTGQWVLGAQVDASMVHMRGENTCFTGLGGVDCQHVVNSLGTITGRIGYAWDRSFAYAKGGGAWVDTTYNLFADTERANRGTGSTALDIWGWTLGGGIEYALTNHWTAFTEYDHIGLPSMPVPFPTVAVINTQTIRANQSVDLFKVGVNYKFDLASLGVTVAPQ